MTTIEAKPKTWDVVIDVSIREADTWSSVERASTRLRVPIERVKDNPELVNFEIGEAIKEMLDKSTIYPQE